MLNRKLLAFALLGAAAPLVHSADEAKKDPKTGKNCVTYMSSELADNGLLRMNFRNICDNQFQIRIPVGDNTRKKTIEAGTPEAPAKAYVTCRPNEGCETAKWVAE